MTNLNKKEKICKCGHLKTEHMKNPLSFLKLTTYCRTCHCNEYMNEKNPTIGGAIVMLVSISCLLIFITLTSLLGVTIFYSIPETDLDKPLEGVTTGDYLTILIAMLVLVCLLLYLLLEEPIFGYFREKKRPNYNVS